MVYGPAYGDGFVGNANYGTGATVYLKGDEITDGSIRWTVDNTGINGEIQLRADGVWNDTGIQISASTIFLGRELEISAFGELIKSDSANRANEALALIIRFDDTGAHEFAVVPKPSAKITDEVIQSDDGTDTQASSFDWTLTATDNAVITEITLKSGAIAATDQVSLTIYRGSDDTGKIAFFQNYPASKFAAAPTAPRLPLDGPVETFTGGDIYFVVESDQNLSLLGNASAEPYWARSYHTITEENIVTFETGMDKIVVSNSDVVTSAGDVVYSGVSA